MMKYQKKETQDKAKKKRGRPKFRQNISVQTDLELSEMTFTSCPDEDVSTSVYPLELTVKPTEDMELSKVMSASTDVKTPASSDGNEEGKEFLTPVSSLDQQDHVSSSLVPVVDLERMPVQSCFERVEISISSSISAEPRRLSSTPQIAIQPIRKTRPQFLTPMSTNSVPSSRNRPRLFERNIQHEPLQQQVREAGVTDTPQVRPALSDLVQPGPSRYCPPKLPLQQQLKPRSTVQNKEAALPSLSKPWFFAVPSHQSTMDVDDILNEVTRRQGQPKTAKEQGHVKDTVAPVKTECRILRSNAKKEIATKNRYKAQSLRKLSGDSRSEETVGNIGKIHAQLCSKVSADARDEETVCRMDKNCSELAGKVSENTPDHQGKFSLSNDTKSTDRQQINLNKGLKKLRASHRKSLRTREKPMNKDFQKWSKKKSVKMRKDTEKEMMKKITRKQTGNVTQTNEIDKACVEGTTCEEDQHSEKKQKSSKERKLEEMVKVKKNKKNTAVTPREIDQIRSVCVPRRMEIRARHDCTNGPYEDSKTRKSIPDQVNMMKCTSSSNRKIILRKIEGKSKEAISGKIVDPGKKLRRESLDNSDRPVKDGISGGVVDPGKKVRRESLDNSDRPVKEGISGVVVDPGKKVRRESLDNSDRPVKEGISGGVVDPGKKVRRESLDNSDKPVTDGISGGVVDPGKKVRRESLDNSDRPVTDGISGGVVDPGKKVRRESLDNSDRPVTDGISGGVVDPGKKVRRETLDICDRPVKEGISGGVVDPGKKVRRESLDNSDRPVKDGISGGVVDPGKKVRRETLDNSDRPVKEGISGGVVDPGKKVRRESLDNSDKPVTDGISGGVVDPGKKVRRESLDNSDRPVTDGISGGVVDPGKKVRRESLDNSDRPVTDGISGGVVDPGKKVKRESLDNSDRPVTDGISGGVVDPMWKARRESLDNSDRPVKKRLRFAETVGVFGETSQQIKKLRKFNVSERTSQVKTDHSHSKIDVNPNRILQGPERTAGENMSEVSAEIGNFRKTSENSAEEEIQIQDNAQNDTKELINTGKTTQPFVHHDRVESAEQGPSEEQGALPVDPSSSMNPECVLSKQQCLQSDPSDYSQPDVNTNAVITRSAATNLLKPGIKERKTTASIWCTRRRRRRRETETLNREMLPFLDRKALIRVRKIQKLLTNQLLNEVPGPNNDLPGDKDGNGVSGSTVQETEVSHLEDDCEFFSNLCLKTTSKFDNCCLHEDGDEMKTDENDVQTAFKATERETKGKCKSELRRILLETDVHTKEMPDVGLPTNSVQHQSVNICDGHSVNVPYDSQSVEVSSESQSYEVLDGQFMEIADDDWFVEMSNEVSFNGQSTAVSHDGQSAEVLGNGQFSQNADNDQCAEVEVSDDCQSVEFSDDCQSVEVSCDSQFAAVHDNGQISQDTDDGRFAEVSDDGQFLVKNNQFSQIGDNVCTYEDRSNNENSGKSFNLESSDMTNDCTDSAVKASRKVDEKTRQESIVEHNSTDIGRLRYTRTAKTTALTAIEKLGIHPRLVKVSGEASSSQTYSPKANIMETSTEPWVTNQEVVREEDSFVTENLRGSVQSSMSGYKSDEDLIGIISYSDCNDSDIVKLPSGNDDMNSEDRSSPSSTGHHHYQEDSGTMTHQGSVNFNQEYVDSFQDSRSDTLRKYASQKSSYWRGLGGWEDSLRPKPKKTQWFQIEHDQTIRKDQHINKTDVSSKPTTSSPKTSSTVPLTLTSNELEKSDLISSMITQSKVRQLSANSTLTEEQGIQGSEQGIKDSGYTKEKDIGCLVWAKLGRESWWPGMIIPGAMARMPCADPGTSWVYWFGDHKISKITFEKIVPFVYNFNQFFGKKTGKLYHSAIMEAVQVCVKRCGIEQSEDSILQWAVDGFSIPQDNNTDQSSSLFDPIPGEELPKEVLENLKKVYNKVTEGADTETKSCRRDVRDARVSALDKVKAGQKKLEDVCIACDDNDQTIHCSHPLFEGGLCRDCKDELTETLFCYGSDGTSVYCVICGFGGELFVCDNLSNCGKAYCVECMELFLEDARVAKIRKAKEWQCFLCTKYSSASHGYLHPYEDWQQRIIKMFDTGFSVTEPDLGYLSSDNKPQIRVLSLFDGIGTAKLILDSLNLDIDKYYSSEIDEDALLVSSVHHGSVVIQIGDITKLDEEKLRSLCPIDLVIGGSPCNDFSLANPLRKGFEFGGTGVLFFHFYRVLKSVQKFNVARHLFWLYENVASMKSVYRKEMSVFLECGPALWDSKFFSPQTRARYFWGNIPGMYSTPELSQQYWSNFHLDTMLSPHCNRKAMVSRIRTVTTRTNSLKQGKKDDLLPVMMNGKEDNIWISELERVFGFPPHYTDVGNLPTTRRQRLLGKSWSVPVVQHILCPLTQYFALKKETDTSTENKEVNNSIVVS